TAEITKLDDLTLPFIDFSQSLQSQVERDQIEIFLLLAIQCFINCDYQIVAAAPFGSARAGFVNQDSAHHVCRDSEEMSAILPVQIGDIGQSQISFVDQGGGLQCVAWILATHIPMREPVQFVVDQLVKIVENCTITLAPGAQ